MIALTLYTVDTGDAADVDKGQIDRETAYTQSLAATIVGTNVVGVARITNRTNRYVQNNK